MAAAKAKVVEVKRPTDSDDDDEEEQVDEDGTASPDSPRKKKKAREVDSEDEAREAEERKKASEAQKALQEMVEKLQTQLSSNVEELRKSIDDTTFRFKRIEQDIEAVNKQMKESANNMARDDEGEGGKISGK